MTHRSHHQHVSARFSAAAKTYIGVSHLQDKVARRVVDLVPETSTPGSVLDAGCGPGRLLRIARTRWPEATLTGVDIAPGMIKQSLDLFSGDPRTEFITDDITQFHPAHKFDLVLSSSALHWLKPFAQGLAHVADMCTPGGMMAIAIMLDGTMRELRSAREAAAPGKMPLGRLPTLAQLEEAAHLIPNSRVRRIEQSASEYDQANAREVLRSVHEMGVTGGDVSRSNTPLTRGEMLSLTEFYDRNFATPQGVRVTFVVGYLLLERES